VKEVNSRRRRTVSEKVKASSFFFFLFQFRILDFKQKFLPKEELSSPEILLD